MNSSVKFFAPSVSDLPLPGWPLGALGLELELELFLSLDPQAARPTASATASKATIVLYHVLLVMRSLPSLSRTYERGALLRHLPPPQCTRRRPALEQGEHAIGQEGE